MKPEWHITAPTLDQHRTRSRVTAEVAGQPVWFESDDAALVPCAEAFVAAFFIPALHTGTTLRLETSLNEDWVAQTHRLLPIFAKWWGYSGTSPVCYVPRTDEPQETDQGGTGQCFTGGIDSFYTLLRGTPSKTHLVYVHGFDVALDEDQRMQAFDASLRAIAAEFDMQAIVVRTNLREHPCFQTVSWERTHGAALATAGLVLSAELDRLVIPSSYAYADETPWGSHWDTDPLWSLPGQLEIIHDDASVARRVRVLHLAEEPLLKQHLRVCWEGQPLQGNCSRCEKCLRTMVLLQAKGQLSAYSAVFDTVTPLPDLLDALEDLKPNLWFVWEDMAGRVEHRATRAAIHRLLRRSKKRRRGGWRKRLGRWRRRMTA